MAKDRRTPDKRIAALQVRVDILDGKIDHLHKCVQEARSFGDANAQAIARNTVITQEVRDILNTFRLVGVAAKWIAAVGAAVGAVIAMVKSWR